jgi:hypothetical protein
LSTITIAQVVTTSASAGIAEVQHITSTSKDNNMAGWFTLDFNGETSAPINFDAPATGAGSVQSNLQIMSTVGIVTVTKAKSRYALPGTVSVTNGAAVATTTDDLSTTLTRGDLFWVGDEQFTVAAVGTFDATNVPLALPTDSTTGKNYPGATAAGLVSYAWANGNVWTVTFSSQVGDMPQLIAKPSTGWYGTDVTLETRTLREGLQPLSGTFRLAFNGQTTPPLSHDVSAVGVKKALEALVTVGTVGVRRTLNGYGWNWVITFTSNLGDLPLIIVDGAGLTGPNADIAAAETVTGTDPANLLSVYISNSGSAQFTYAITSLTQGTPYLVRVTATNSQGYSGVRLSTPVSEIPRTQPSAPTSTQLLVLTGTSLKVVWSPVASTGGNVVDKYLIEWDMASDFSNVGSSGYSFVFSDLSANAGAGPFFYNIEGLLTNVAYYVRVSAHNDRGYGPTAATTPAGATPVFLQPSAPFSATLSVVSGAELLVEWTPPNDQLTIFGGDGGKPITQYLIEWDTDFALDPAPSSAIVTGPFSTTNLYTIGARDTMSGETAATLSALNTYFVRISAYNNQGYGPVLTTTPMSLQPSDQVPRPATTVSASPVSGTSLLANWAAPTSDGGLTLDKFKVEYDTTTDFSSGSYGSQELLLREERQGVAISADIQNEVQSVRTSVLVTNERQQVDTSVTGVDEVQTITTSADTVVAEVQTITTYANDINEVQTQKLLEHIINTQLNQR